ncbi:hypothetical protein [Sphingomonas sp. RIT328]|uniref:hypothetical protein n=1 Tax=Sphingomonas sp. RIT328 TaxID=1470591 RepID=UPI00044E9369|nr:hypothetical protein [Sphingomonas sp. RIT328]EZP57281.1 hypothetical protein BW41_00124 [Sphingomonas sp. RIT328]
MSSTPTQADGNSVLWPMLNSPWFGLLITVVIGVAGLYAGWIFYRRQKTVPSVVTSAKSIVLVAPAHATIESQLEISFNGLAVPQVTSSVIAIWNNGTTIFRRNDIADKDPLKLRLTNGSFLQVTIDGTSRTVIGAQIKFTNNKEFLVSFDFLEPKDAIIIRALHTGTHGDLRITGTLIGLPEGLKFFNPAGKKLLSSDKIDKAFIAAMVTTLVAGSTAMWLKSGWRSGLIIPAGVVGFILGAVLLIWIVEMVGARWKKNVPNVVLDNADLRRSLELQKLFGRI